ncbi:MAG: ParA family protein [Armatimonadota bacterium]|nr:ParA family protein [Armatimonadota bacterium]MDR7469435.1 ParA family protein [Armatimonadota bacterium]MDR7473859.1 ParA family protein [Armatimonadota bacterium]MDR7539082.1 ParA family protein [Armatimonadota bacterium]
MHRTIAIVNQKGGVGKSTTAVNLGASLAVLGTSVLVCDLDPQANATSGLGTPKPSAATSTYGVIIEGRPLQACVVSTAIPGLSLLPSSSHLSGAEVELVSMVSRESRLRQALQDGAASYEVVLLDCPPSLGLLTVNALTAATEVLIPIQCEYYALEGLSQLLESITLVQRYLNPALEVGGVLLTMFDARTRLSEQVAAEVRRFFKDKVYKTVIPRSIRLAEAPSYGMPMILFDPSSRGADAYVNLAKEVVTRGRDAATLAGHVG